MMLYAGSRLAVPLLTSVMSVRCFFEASKEDAKGATALTRLPIPAVEGALRNPAPSERKAARAERAQETKGISRLI